MSKIIGVTVGTPISTKKIGEKLNPVKTVNGIAPDANGNVKVNVHDGSYVLTEKDKADIVASVLAEIPPSQPAATYTGEVEVE